jgi:hypothetical protein
MPCVGKLCKFVFRMREVQICAIWNNNVLAPLLAKKKIVGYYFLGNLCIMFFFLYGFATWLVILRAVHTFRATENGRRSKIYKHMGQEVTEQVGMLPWHWPRHKRRGYRAITVVLAKHKVAPWWWFLREPKNIEATIGILIVLIFLWFYNCVPHCGTIKKCFKAVGVSDFIHFRQTVPDPLCCWKERKFLGLFYSNSLFFHSLI